MADQFNDDLDLDKKPDQSGADIVNKNQRKAGKGLVNKKIQKVIVGILIASVLGAAAYQFTTHEADTAKHLNHIKKSPPEKSNISTTLPPILTVPINKSLPPASSAPLPLHTNSSKGHSTEQSADQKEKEAKLRAEKLRQAQVDAGPMFVIRKQTSTTAKAENPNTPQGQIAEIRAKIKKNEQEEKKAEAEAAQVEHGGIGATIGKDLEQYQKYVNGGAAGPMNVAASNSGPATDRTSIQGSLDGAVAINQPSPRLALSVGTVIPATLITRVNTEVPGNVEAQVNRNIYNARGQLVIPGGSKLIGSYASDVANGQDRIYMAFNELVYPDGQFINLGGMTSDGPRGASGTEGTVHNHFWSSLSSALFVALVSQGLTSLSNAAGTQQAGGISSGPSSVSGNSNSVSTSTSNYGQQEFSAGSQVISQELQQLLEPYMSQQPNITKKQGARITIVLTKNVLFPAYNY